MLTPAYLAGCADQVAAMFSQLEADITADVAARVAKMGRYSETSQWQAQKLREAEAAYDMCQRMLKTCRKSANKEIQEVLLNGCREAMRADDSIYRAAGMHTYSISSSEALMDIILAGLAKTNGVMDNLTMTTARDASHSIQSALDRAYMQVMSGAYSYDQAAARVIRDLGSKGYTCFKYDSGTHTSLEAATRRALLTGLNQTTAELQLHRATDLGTELVEVSSHAGARPTHAVWQGEIYSLHGDTGKYRDFYRETEYGDGDGLCGWNCYHNFYPYVEGVSAPTFEKDPARRLGKTNDELYEETQQQRYYERQVRKSRRECSTLSAAMDAADDLLRERLRPEFTKASVLLKRREAALRAFCEKTGLPYDASRVATFAFGRSTSAKAVWANRKEKHTGGHGLTSFEKWERRQAKREKKAADQYEKIRNADDVSTVAKSAGMSEEDVRTVKQHVFFDKHILYDGVVDRFEPDYDMAVAWKRLSEGNPTETDILLLQHEKLENDVEKQYNITASEAHALATKQYDWSGTIYDKFGEDGEPDDLL